MALYAGEVVGPYTLLYRLGSGGMAEVWAAQHGTTGRAVALKVLFSSAPAIRARLLREGRALATMDHPHILPVEDTIDVHGAPGLVLPLIAGPALDVLLAAYRPTPDEALALLVDIAAGVGHAHRQGLIHRDLKPGNVLLDLQDDRVVPRVGDFGLVKILDEARQTRTGELMGTLSYAAPEQLLDAASVDHRADLFSLGVLLTELLSGQRLHDATSLRDILALHSRPPALADLPAAWRPLCAALLQRDPDLRLSSCAALLAQITATWSRPTPDPLRADGPLAAAARQLWQHGRLRSAPRAEGSTLDAASRHSAAPSAPTHNLPPEGTDFVGRRLELDALAARLDGSGGALLSLLGPAGSGKTRLAQHLAWALLRQGALPGGAWLCDLSEVRTPEGICVVVARVLGISPGGEEPVARLGRALGGRGRCLLVLDNFEQLVAAAPETIGAWRAAAPEAILLVTSRVRLGLDGEQTLTLGELTPADAEALFVARARAAHPGLVVDAAARESIAALVGLLDGLPLAIELAAARARIMSPQAMQARVHQRFQLLRGEQGTLQGAIDWSWALLSPWEQAAFAQCGVFEGGFTLEAAEAVVDLSGWPDAPWLPDVLQGLVDASLLRSLSAPGTEATPRLGMFLSLQAYARQHLAAQPDLRDAATRRHAAYYARLHSRAGGTPETTQWRWALLAELDNLLCAHRHSLALGDLEHAGQAALHAAFALLGRAPAQLSCALLEPTIARLSDAALPPHLQQLRLRLEERLALVYRDQGRTQDAIRLLEQLQAAWTAHDKPASRVSVLGELGMMHQRTGRPAEAQAALDEALRLARAAGLTEYEGGMLERQGALLISAGRLPEAEPYYRQALAIARTHGFRKLEGSVLGNLALIPRDQGRLDEALDLLQQALDIALERGDQQTESNLRSYLAGLFIDLGYLSDAEQNYQTALRIHRRSGALRLEGVVLGNLAVLYTHQDRLPEALAALERALAISRLTHTPRDTAIHLINTADILCRQGHPERAAEHYTQAIDLLRPLHSPYVEGAAWAGLGAVRGQQGDTAQGLADIAHGESLLRSHGDPLMLGSILCARATLERRAALDATATLDEIRQIITTLRLSPDAELSRKLHQLEAAEVDSQK